MAIGRLAVGDVPGLKSVPIATGMPRSMNVRAGAPWSFMRNQVVAGRTVATTGSILGGGQRERIDPGLGWRREVVRRRGPELGRQLGPARRGQLIGMEPGQQPVAGGRLQDPPGLVRVEHPALAEDVAEPCPAVRRDPGQLLLDDRPDVGLGAVGPAPELGRHGVGAEVGRDHVDRALLAEPVGRPR